MSKELKKPKDISRLQTLRDNIILRSRVIREIRNFFNSNGFIETDTPALIKAPAPEDYINAPQSGAYFLRSSPELHMKRLSAAGFDKIFQIGPCFRSGEIGNKHNVEFTMLEWYETSCCYDDMVNFQKDMLKYVVSALFNSLKVNYKDAVIDFSAPWVIFTIEKAFRKFAGITPEEAIRNDEFEIILTQKIEPALPKDRPCILKDYPASMAALSKVSPKNPAVAERCELYLAGIEISNSYSELIDYNEQQERFRKAHLRRKAAGLPAYPEDEEFFEALKSGMKDFAGCALGVDRLVMVLANAEDIRSVNSFIEF